MSWSNYERSMKLAQQCRFYTTEGGKTPDEIKKAEKLLGVQFSKQYKDFCKNYGYLSFYGNEIFGIDPDNLEILEGNCVAYALNDRKVYELPRHCFSSGYRQCPVPIDHVFNVFSIDLKSLGRQPSTSLRVLRCIYKSIHAAFLPPSVSPILSGLHLI